MFVDAIGTSTFSASAYRCLLTFSSQEIGHCIWRIEPSRLQNDVGFVEGWMVVVVVVVGLLPSAVVKCEGEDVARLTHWRLGLWRERRRLTGKRRRKKGPWSVVAHWRCWRGSAPIGKRERETKQRVKQSTPK